MEEKGDPPYLPGGRILEVARRWPHEAALLVDDEQWSYRELLGAARSLADRMAPTRDGEPQPVTGVMAHRHLSSYVGILAARLSGHAFVPIAVDQPPARNAALLRTANVRQVVCGDRGETALAAMLEAAQRHGQGWKGTVVRCADDKTSWQSSAAARDSSEIEPLSARTRAEWPTFHPASLEDLAYILFTSGSTGEPKGVPIPNRGLESFLPSVRTVVNAHPGDRFSQTFALAFDVAMHDLFACWQAGATLVVPSAQELRKPAAYVRRRQLTHWASIPSLADLIRRQGELTPSAFPSLRFSIFIGEALPTALAREWRAAAPNSRVENWYGPTEATIMCARYAVENEPIPFDVVPIGKPLPGTGLAVLNEHADPCPPGEVGEIVLSGPQLADSYLDNPAETRARFVTLPDGNAGYRTGDLGVAEADGNVRFIGRADNQIKLRGRRLELGPVEAALRELAGNRSAIVLGWPPAPHGPTMIVALVESDGAAAEDLRALRRGLADRLPPYLTPAKFFSIAELPRQANGKVDHPALHGWLADRMARERRSQGNGPRLSRNAKLLLDAVLALAPHLDRSDVLGSRNLIDAGMDSLAFVALTAEMEELFGIALDHRAVVELATMPFDRIAREVRGDAGVRGTAYRLRRFCERRYVATADTLRRALRRPRVLRTPRANRVAHFIRRFPAYLHEYGAPDVLAVGTSGVYRAFFPPDFEAEVAALGQRARALNAGFPAVNATDMRTLGEFVAEHCAAASVRIPHVLFEICMETVSMDPPPGPPGTARLDQDVLSGNVIMGSGDGVREYEWSAEAGGAWNAPASLGHRRRPLWALKRDRAIVDIYLGKIGIDRRAADEWVAGGSALAKVAERMTCFVHPLSPDHTPGDQVGGGARFMPVHDYVTEAARELGTPALTWRDFDLGPSDFLDINHLHPWGGRQNFSRQLARLLFDANGEPRARKP